MIRKVWIVWMVFFIIAAIGTYFIFQQIFDQKMDAISVEEEINSTDEEIKNQTDEKPSTENNNTEGKETEGSEKEEVKEDAKLTDEDIKNVVKGLIEGILQTFRELGAEHNWSNRSNPADFDILKPALLQHASKAFTNGHLKDLAGKYYCECDAPLIPYPSMDIRFTVRENTSGKIIASSIEFSNELHGDNGGTIYFTIIKENGNWVMEGWSYVSPEEEDMHVTWKEYEAYVGEYNKVTFLNEVTHNGENVYVFFNHDANSLNAVYASSTNSIYDFPIDWIPVDYRIPPYYLKSLESNGGKLEISNVSGNVFDFHLNIDSSEVHVGNLMGMAVVDGTKGIFHELEYGCELNLELGVDTIEVSENAGCTAWHGVSFEGVFRKEE
jgi:cell division protein FtsL